MEEGRPWHDRIPGLHGKNLFIKDRKGGIWLVVMPADKRADLGWLEKALGAPRFSFARPDVLQEVLALTPGSVTPFGLINDTQRRVTVILDKEILESEWVNFHPLHNAASTTLRSADLLRFVRALGYEPIVVRLPGAPADDSDAGISLPARPSSWGRLGAPRQAMPFPLGPRRRWPD